MLVRKFNNKKNSQTILYFISIKNKLVIYDLVIYKLVNHTLAINEEDT